MVDKFESDAPTDVAHFDKTQAPNAAHRPLAPRGKAYAAGTSGNARGRPFGSRNKSTVLAQSFFDDVAKAITEKAIALALEGDPVALKLCVERILPRRRDSAIVIEDLPDVDSAADCKMAVAAVIRSAAAGEISPSQAQVFVGLIEAHTRTLNVAEFEQRLVRIEEKMNGVPRSVA
jgi:hypothetical protein